MDPQFFVYWLPAVVAVFFIGTGLFLLSKGLYLGYLFFRIVYLDHCTRLKHGSLSDIVEWALRRYMYDELPVSVKGEFGEEVVFVPWGIPPYRADGNAKRMRKTIKGMKKIREAIGRKTIDPNNTTYYITVIQDGGLPYIEVNDKRHDYVKVSLEGEVSKASFKDYVLFLATEEGPTITHALHLLQTALYERSVSDVNRLTTISNAIDELYEHGVGLIIRGRYILVSRDSRPVREIVLRNILIDKGK